MSLRVDRRQWLKTSAFAAAGLALPRHLVAAPPGTEAAPLPRTVGHAGQFEGVVKLNSNENPYGISERARRAVVEATANTHIYSHHFYPELVEPIARDNGLTPDHIMLGAGSTELLSIAGLRYGAQGGKVLMADPGYFDMHDFYVRVGADLHLVPVNDAFEHDLEAMDRALTREYRQVYIANPNNPTATVVGSAPLRDFCEQASRRTKVFIDEAYHDFGEDPYGSMVGLVRQGADVLIFRTFSKIHGLAGARVGYIMAKPEIIEELGELATNFAPISNLGLRAAIASYQDDEYLRTCRERNRDAKVFLYHALDELNYFYVPSHTNFVLFRIRRDRREAQQRFRERDIMIRTFEVEGAPWIRVSMGTMDQMRTFVTALEAIAP